MAKSMNRADVFRATHGISLKEKVGTAQNLFLSSTQSRLGAAGAFTLTCESQRPCLLQTVTIDADNAGAQCTGDITTLTVAGQETLVSDKAVSLGVFSATSFNSKCRSLGISVNNNMKVVIQGNLTNTGGNVSTAIALDPIPEDRVQTRQAQAAAYSYVFGLGSKGVPAAGNATLSARSNRAVTLGEILLTNETNPGAFVQSSDIVITSIKIGGLEMLNSATGATEISLNCFSPQNTDYMGLNLAYVISPQTEVEVELKSYDAVNAAEVGGAIFCEPWSK